MVLSGKTFGLSCFFPLFFLFVFTAFKKKIHCGSCSVVSEREMMLTSREIYQQSHQLRLLGVLKPTGGVKCGATFMMWENCFKCITNNNASAKLIYAT